MDPVVFYPIGHVENDFDERGSAGPREGFPSRIVVNNSFADGLDGLESGQEVFVVFWLHHSTGYELRQHPRGDATRAKRGVFSLRSPNRPNPIGITQVPIGRVAGNVLYVTDLDAFDGTPILDLKPVNCPEKRES